MFLLVLLASALTWLFSGPLGLEARMMSLANDPGVSTAFQDRDSGRTDAMITLIAFAALTPIAAGVAAIVVILLIKGIEAVLVSIRIPGWLSAPVFVAALVFGVYTLSDSWMSESRHAVSLVARAYFVYYYGAVPVFYE